MVAVRDLVLIILDVESLIGIVGGSGRCSGFRFGVAVGPFRWKVLKRQRCVRNSLDLNYLVCLFLDY